MTTGRTRKRDERLSLCITSERKQLIARAAAKEQKNISDFILENAVSAAEAIVFDDANFSLDKKRWKRLVVALDAPRETFPLFENS